MLQIGKKVFWLAATTLVLTSCWSKDKGKGHEEPVLMACRFTEGILTEPSDGSINVQESAFVPSVAEPVTYQLRSDVYGNFSLISSSKPLKLKEGVWYKLENFLFDTHSQPMTDVFFQPNQIEIHQFFYNLLSKNNVVANGISYYYSDYKNGQLLESPVGFTGYFRINKKVEDPELRLILVHVQNGTKYEADGKPNPFDKPSTRVLEFGDLIARIPFGIE
ncbi:hypothetical protein [Porphyromonas loveana]|uniref:hypothetical protein n=1 Tax=Porphyromonas loveana TaxID=1884669 RepID=UPI0035A06639